MSQARFLVYFCLTTLFWGGSFLGIHYSLESFSPLFAAFLRIFAAFCFISVYLLFKKDRPPLFTNTWRISMLLGILGMVIPWIFLFWAEKFVPPAIAAIINSTVPIFVALMIPLVTPKDKLTTSKIIGVLLSFLGIFVIFYPAVSASEWTNHLAGLVALIFMSISYALGIIITRRYADRLNNETNIFHQLISGGIIMLIISLIFGGELMHDVSLRSVLSVSYLGIFSTGLALIFFFEMI